MRKIFYSVASVLISLTLSAGANAQASASGKDLYKFSVAAARSHVPEAAPGLPSPKARRYLNSINIRAVRDFMKRHVNVDNESWAVTDNGGFKVNFIAGGRDCTTYYNKHGNWTNSLKMYTEAQLSFKIRAMVKREYYDYNIAQIYEIESLRSNYKPTYIIRIENEHSFVFIMIQDGEMGIWKELDKQQ